MKKLLVLFDKIGPKGEFLAEYIAQNMGSDKKVMAARFADLVFFVDEKKVKILVEDVDIKEFDLVYIRRADHKMFALAGTLALCLEKLGVPYVDTKFREIGAAGDKFTSFVKLSLANLPTIPTIFCLSDKVESMKDQIITNLGFPIIAKDMVSQHGAGIFILKDASDFKKLPEKDGERLSQYLFQKHVAIDKEYRLLVLGDKVVSAQKMTRNLTGFQAQIDQTAPEEFVSLQEIPEEMKRIAVAGARELSLQIAGADLFVEKQTGKIGVLEINRGPGFTYDPKISPELPKLAEFLKKELDGKR